jgi:hypothetical protein
MTTIDELLKELYNTGSDIANGLEHDGRIGLALQVRLQEALARAERFMADNANGNNKPASKPASKGKASKFATLKSLIELLKPFMVTRATLPILKAVNFNTDSMWVTDLDNVTKIYLFGGVDFGGRSVIELDQLLALGNVSLSAGWSMASKWTVDVEEKIAEHYNKTHKLGTEFDTEEQARAYGKEKFEGKDVLYIQTHQLSKITVTDAGKTFTLAGLDPQDAPVAENHYFKNGTTYEGETSLDVIQAMARVASCAAKDQSRPILSGVCVEINDGKMKLTTADGFKLLHDVIDTDLPDLPQTVVPAAWLDKVVKALNKIQPDKVRLFIGKAGDLDRILIKGSNDALLAEFSASLIPGKFPEYNQVIPNVDKMPVTVKVNRARFLDIVKDVMAAGKGIDKANGAHQTYWEFGSEDNEHPLVVKVGEHTILNFDGLEVSGVDKLHINPALIKQVVEGMTSEELVIRFSEDYWEQCQKPEQIRDYRGAVRFDCDTALGVVMPCQPNR